MIKLVCPKCEKKLGVDDSKAGYGILCPRCGNKFRIPGNKVQAVAHLPPRTSPRPPAPPGLPPDLIATKLADPTGRAAPPPSPFDDLDEEPLVLYPQEDSRKPEPEHPGPFEDLDEVEVLPEEEPEPPAPEKPRKGKKKKRRRRSGGDSENEDGDLGTPAWVLWLVFFGVYFLSAGVAFGIAVSQGAAIEALLYSVFILAYLPVAVVMLLISMVIASSLGGGIDFGNIFLAILKAGAVLMVVLPITFIHPMFGPVLAYPVWLAGFMMVFRLDFFEAGLLSTVNWALNFMLRWAIETTLMTAFMNSPAMKGGPDIPFPDSPPTFRDAPMIGGGNDDGEE